MWKVQLFVARFIGLERNVVWVIGAEGIGVRGRRQENIRREENRVVE